MQNARHRGAAGDASESLEAVLRGIEASITTRLAPAIARRPLQTLSQAAAAGFVLGILVPVRLQVLALRPLVALGMHKLLEAQRSSEPRPTREGEQRTPSARGAPATAGDGTIPR